MSVQPLRPVIRNLALCAVNCALCVSIANAATRTVTSTGDDATDPATLRGAIAAAADGDTIVINNHGPSRSWSENAKNGGWEHLQFVYNGTAIGSTGRTYGDGEDLGGITISTGALAYPYGMGLVSWRGGGANLDADLDEVRIRLGPSSADWARANYLAMRPDVPYLGVELMRDFPPSTVFIVR